MAINKIKINGTEHELQTTIANVTNLQASLDAKANLNGATFTDTVKFNEVDGDCINFNSGIYINKQNGSTLLGSDGTTTSWIGTPQTNLKLRGSGVRPTYNDNAIALKSDVNAITLDTLGGNNRYYTEAEIDAKISTLNSVIADKASLSTANIYNGEQKFQNSQYCPTAQDNASGVGAAYKASRGVVNQEIVGQIIMPYTTVSDDYGCDNVANTIKFQKITGTNDGTPTLSTVATLTDSYLDVPSLKVNGSALSKSSVGLGNVDNTSDVNKPISTATQTALDGKASSSHTHTIANITNLQSSLNAKQATVTGGASTITGSDLTASRALISNSSGKVAVSAVTSTELGYLDGVTSNVQTQLNGKAASSHNHTKSQITDFLNYTYPVGAIYMSVESTSPASIFGGTWEQITDTFLLAAGSIYSAGSTGGEATHTLSLSEAPYKYYGMGVRPFDYSSNTDLTVYGHTNVTTKHTNDWGTWYGLKTGGVSRNYYTWVEWSYGGGGAHNNMPPYLAVYVWKRTA